MQGRSTLKIAAWLLAVVAVLAVGLVIAVKSVNLDSIKELLTDQVQTATGRTLTINGPLKMRLGLIPRVVADDITLSNPPGASRPDMLRIKHFEMAIALLPLLNREILVNRLDISSPDILIETGANGARNLDIPPPAIKSEPKPSPVEHGSVYRFNLHEVTVENGVLAWYDHETGKTESMEIHKLTVQPYQTSAELLAVRLAARAWGHEVHVEGTVGQFDTAMGGKPWPVYLQGGIEGMAITVKGSVSELPTFRGPDLILTAQGEELYKAMQLAGLTRPDMPQSLGPFKLSARLTESGTGALVLTDVDAEAGKRAALLLKAKGTVKNLTGAMGVDLALNAESDDVAQFSWLSGTPLPVHGPAKFSGQLRGHGHVWKFSDCTAGLGDSDMQGELTVESAKRLHITGKLSARTLNLHDFTGPTKPTSGENRVFSNQPLPVQGLRLADVDLGLQVGKMVLDTEQLIDTVTELHLKDGQLTLKPFRTGLAGGTVEGEATLDAAGKVPVVALRLTGHEVELGKLSDQKIISGGKSDLKVDVKGQGDSVRALMATASGETVLSVGEGRIENKAVNWAGGDLLFQLLSAVNPMAKKEDTTPMSCAAARFVIRDGIATTRKGLAMRTDKVDVVGSGTVDLRSETLDLGISPRPRQGVGISLSAPFAGLTRLRGTFVHPSVGIDSEGTLRAAASMGAAAATGGLSMLGELLFDKVSADADPCRTALGQSSVKQKGPAGKKRQPQKQKSGNFLQDIFGR